MINNMLDTTKKMSYSIIKVIEVFGDNENAQKLF